MKRLKLWQLVVLCLALYGAGRLVMDLGAIFGR